MTIISCVLLVIADEAEEKEENDNDREGERESNKNLLGSNLCQQNVTIIVERIPSHVKGKWNVSIIRQTFGTKNKHLLG
jgi:DNA-binding HxlR family transcriptional regulator